MLCEAEAGPADISHSAGVLMSDFRWYIACRTDSVTASRLTEGQHYTVTLQNNGSSPIDMEYYRLLSNATDAVMIFKSMRIPENFDFTRCQNAVITYAEEIGYRIPVSAVRIYDGQEGVMILDHTKIDFRRIAVTGEENGYYLCSAEDPESPSETDSEESAVTAESYDTVSGGEADGITLYPYLQENDIVIKSGTGLSVGMTYDPKGN